MTDIFDQASDRTEQDLALALKVRLPTLKACGACHNCGESVAHGQLFCRPEPGIDGSCRDDWEQREAARRRNGG
jgi:hypothetical protein